MLPRVVFHHVHKCAGTTLLKFLEGTTAPERTAAIERLVGTPDPDGVELRLAIDCREAVASPDRIDTRSLGVEIAEIELAPVERMPPRSLTALAHVRDQWALLAGTPDGDRRMQHFLDTLPGGTLAPDVSCPPYAESRRG